MMPCWTSYSVLLLFLFAAASKGAEAPNPTSHRVAKIEGWDVRIDDRLDAQEFKQLSIDATVLLGDRLRDIKRSLREQRVRELQKVVIQLDLSHGQLDRMQYHPSRHWLKEHDYSENLEKCIHIPVASSFASVEHQQIQPWSVLHELAHAYHDQVLGNDNRDVLAVFQSYRESGAGNNVAHINGEVVRHYALSNHKEFFAEMSEAYLGRNDFYPFVRAELKIDFPEVYELMQSIWGTLRETSQRGLGR